MTPEPPDDDAIADALADEVTERILAEHPRSSPEFRKKLVGLYLAQATGREKPPGRISLNRLALHLGQDRHTLQQEQSRALAKLWRAFHARYPDLL